MVLLLLLLLLFVVYAMAIARAWRRFFAALTSFWSRSEVNAASKPIGAEGRGRGEGMSGERALEK